MPQISVVNPGSSCVAREAMAVDSDRSRVSTVDRSTGPQREELQESKAKQCASAGDTLLASLSPVSYGEGEGLSQYCDMTANFCSA